MKTKQLYVNVFHDADDDDVLEDVFDCDGYRIVNMIFFFIFDFFFFSILLASFFSSSLAVLRKME